MKIRSFLIGDKVSSNSVAAHNLFSTQEFGSRSGDKVFYSFEEAFFLVKSGKMEVFDFRDCRLSQKVLQSRFVRLDRGFHNNYLVFRDLRSKGYVVKSGLKFGAPFRVYPKGKKVGSKHSKWVCFPVSGSKGFSWFDFVSKNRVAHSTKKNLLIAVVDSERSISYFEVNWTKP